MFKTQMPDKCWNTGVNVEYTFKTDIEQSLKHYIFVDSIVWNKNKNKHNGSGKDDFQKNTVSSTYTYIHILLYKTVDKYWTERVTILL